MFTHSGRKVLVTGGNRGIGLGIAAELASNGAGVAILGRDAESGNSSVERIRDGGGKAHFLRCDLRDVENIPDVVSQAREVLGGIDAICHSAGIYPERHLQEMSVSEWNDVMDTNLTSAMVLVRETVEDMEASGNGRVVFISSITGPRTSIDTLSHYGASKSGLEGFMRAAAIALAPRGITVNSVAPGTILTESLEELYSDPDVLAEVTARIPVGRIGVPEDIAAATSFLMSERASFITGQSIILDGGQTLPEVQ